MNTQTASFSLSLPHQFIEERQDVIFRRVRGILNKITPETFDKLSKELVNVGLDSPRTLRGVIYLLFDKALKDLKYSSLYAKLCQELSEKTPNFEHEPGPNSFCKFLISKCEDEFERRRRATEDFDSKNELTDEEYEQKAIAKQKMLGNIKFICELGKKRLLQEEILHECIRGLLSKKKERPIQDQAQDLECLCQIMRTIGSLLDIQASRNLMNQYFERIDMFSKKPELPSRIRFMLRDVIDLRNNNWRPRPFQREDNVPQPLSKLREEAGYDPKANSTIDKFGNSRSLIGISDLSKLHGNKLSMLLDDEPSFTTSSDFHWGPTFLPLDQSFDPFAMSATRHKQTSPISLSANKFDTSLSASLFDRSRSNYNNEPPTESNNSKLEKQSPLNILKKGHEAKRFVETTAFERRPFLEANPIIARDSKDVVESAPKFRSGHMIPQRTQREEPQANNTRKLLDQRLDPPQPIRGNSTQQAMVHPTRRQNSDFGPALTQPPPNLPSHPNHKFDARNAFGDSFEHRDRRFQPRPTHENDHRPSKFSNNLGYRPARHERPVHREYFSFDRNSHLESDLNLNWRAGPNSSTNNSNNIVGQQHVTNVQRPVEAKTIEKPMDSRSGGDNFNKPTIMKPFKPTIEQIPQVRKTNEVQEKRPLLDFSRSERFDREIPIVTNHRGNLVDTINYNSNTNNNSNSNFHASRIENDGGPSKMTVTEIASPGTIQSPSRITRTRRSPPLETNHMPLSRPGTPQNNSNQRYNPHRTVQHESIEKRESRWRFNHQNHQGDEHSPRFTENGTIQLDRTPRQLMNKNHQIESQHIPQSDRMHNWRKAPFVAPTDAANKDPPIDKPTSVLPKPPTKLVDTNFSLRPSHNLIGRAKNTLSSTSTKTETKQESLDSAQARDGSTHEENSQANVKQIGRFQPETAQASPQSSDLPPVKLASESLTGTDMSPTKAVAKDFHLGKFMSVITESFNEMFANGTRIAAKIKELKIPKSYQKDCLVSAMKQSILKSESERDSLNKLFVQLIPSTFEAQSLIDAFKMIFEQLQALEVETPKVKSLVAGLLSQSIFDGLFPLDEVGLILSGGKHHPLFLLCLQRLDKSAGQAWLSEKFIMSKINLMDMLPESDQSKERLASVLKDRCLGFLDPMLTIEPDLWEQMYERDPSPAAVYRWIKDNVSLPIQNTPTFAHVLIYCLLRYIHNTARERSKFLNDQKDNNNSDTPASSDKSSPLSQSAHSQSDVEKELLIKYQQVLQAILKDKQMQLATLYSLQSFYHGLEFPKGSLLRWFHMMYDMNVVDEDVFFTWKEEINDKVPGKGQALFQVNTWLNWLAEAESEDEEDEDEEEEEV